MKLAFKLVLATVVGILVIFAIFGVIRAQREVALFDSDMRKDHRLIGATLGLCVANTWMTAGPDNAIELVAQADADRPGLQIGWIHPNGHLSARAPVLFPADVATVSHIEHQVRSAPEDPQQSFLVTRIPVRHGNTLIGLIEIAENLSARDAYVQASVGNALVATVSMFVVAGIVVLSLGVWLVGRPLQAVADKARRIGRGEPSSPLRLQQRDEIGQLAQEVDAMCERIAEANARTEAESTARLQAIEQLRHADRLITVGRLAAGIAHELGTPLNIVMGRLKMLRKGGLEPATISEYLDESTGQLHLMATIIRQLVDFARRREPKATSTDLLHIANSIARLVEPLARKRSVSVVVTSQESTNAMVDPMQIEQVLSNLVINAIHACNEGGKVEIAFGLRSADATATPTAQSLRAFLRVSDNGQGMDREVMERVFEPFFTTKDVGQGTGLGLSVAHGIVQDHGGHISVASTPNQGSVFTVFLPSVAS